MRRLVLLLFSIVLAGCAAQPLNTPQPTQTLTAIQAFDVLGNFLRLLHEKNYGDAAPLYGGDYEQLHVFNPQIDPNDHVALWSWACDHQLLQCLEVRSATLKHQEGDAYVFQVEFNKPDGSLFVLGPCCGANETEMPPVSQFEYTVIRNSEGKFVVMNMPPYVP
jgi:hypothetical protein